MHHHITDFRDMKAADKYELCQQLMQLFSCGTGVYVVCLHIACLFTRKVRNAALCLVPNLGGKLLRGTRTFGVPIGPPFSRALHAGNRAASSTKLIPTCRHEQKEASPHVNHNHSAPLGLRTATSHTETQSR